MHNNKTRIDEQKQIFFTNRAVNTENYLFSAVTDEVVVVEVLK